MFRFAKQLVIIVLFLVVAGCAGGGCSSGCSCAGITPLAEGFDVDRRIENAASVRLTDAGIGFLESNIGALAAQLLGDSVLTFEVPTISEGGFPSYTVCVGGPDPNSNPPKCIAEIDVGGLDLTSQGNYGLKPSAPHNLVIEGRLPIRVRKLPMKIIGFDADVTVTGNNECSGNQTFANILLRVEMSLEIDEDVTHSRYGYTRVRVADVSINEDDIDDALRFCASGGILSTIGSFILNTVKGLVVGQLVSPLIGTVQEQIDQQLCQQANPALSPPCPTGTQNIDGVCRYGNNANAECASIILGLDGNIDIGALLAALSPGAKGGFDFLFAGGGDGLRQDGSGYHWGDLNPIGNGVSLGLYGGTEPTPITGCVPLAEVALPTGIPFPDELLDNTLPDWPNGGQPHFGLGLNERFTNYLLAQTYNSGALCLGITADALGDSVPLTTALVAAGVGAPSMTELARQKEAAELAMVLRPQTPPSVVFGNGTDIQTDPNVRLTMEQLSIDFYVWSLDRFVRVLTATLDLEIPLNIIVTPEGLQPAIEELVVANATVTNSGLLREDPTKIAESLQSLLGSLVGSALGDALPPINISEQFASLGLSLDIPPSIEGQGSPGLRKLVKGNDNYLGIFASFGLATPMMDVVQPQRSKTRAELTDLQVDPAGLHVSTYTRHNGPQATVQLGSDLDDGTNDLEWQYKVNKGPWHPFTKSRQLLVKDPLLRAQGRHTIFVRSRVVGNVQSLDPEPVAIEVIVDAGAPQIAVKQDSQGLVSVNASDYVSGNQTKVRMRLGYEDANGEPAFYEWSEWIGARHIAAFDPGDASTIEVEAIDEDGHTATTSQALRGRELSDGCQCSVPTSNTLSPAKRGGAWLLALCLGMAAIFRRRSSKRAAARAKKAGSVVKHALFAAAFVAAAGSMAGCSCSGDDTTGEVGCRKRGDCSTLAPGLVGAYGSAASAPDGTLWVAGYLEANWEDAYSFGDLVVGPYDGTRVLWEVVDGTDPNEVVDGETYDPQGFRGGRVDPGPDVGLWTSIAVDDAGLPAVAYYDATARALRYARYDGEKWSADYVQQAAGADLGRYAKLLFVDGQPQIVYQFSEPGENGLTHSGVRIARSTSLDGGNWSYEDVVNNSATPCRPYLCAAGTECTIEEGVCADTSSDCATECEGSECVVVNGAPTCAAVYAKNKTATYPDAVGLYISAARRPDGTLGIAYYDRVNGDLVVASKTGPMWSNVIADGATGDSGIGASLDIDAQGNFHLVYINGLDESLSYTMVEGGTTPGPVEIVDDGLGHPDGHHLVGDDADLVVTQAGEIRVSYQDATNGTLRYAVGTPAGGAHNWTSKAIAQDDFAGYFSKQVEVDGQLRVFNWWRRALPSARGDVRLLAP